MTTCSYTLVLGDDECFALKTAIEERIKVCERHVARGEGAPYWADLHSLKAVHARLFQNVQQTSGRTEDGAIFIKD